MAWFVNDERIDEKEVQAEANRLRPQYERHFQDMAPDAREAQLLEWSRENIVERALMRQAALRDLPPIDPEETKKELEAAAKRQGGKEKLFEALGVGPDDEEKALSDLERHMRAERLARQIQDAAPEPEEAAMLAFYNENKEQFMAPEMVRAAHIVKHPNDGEDPQKVEKKMRKLREELAKGADFAQAAARNSDCPDNGGDLGYFPRGQMVPEFENVVFSLKRGQISEVFRTEFGLHIATVTDKRPARPYEFEQVKDTIRRELRGGLRQKAIEDFIDAERAKARIEERPDLT